MPDLSDAAVALLHRRASGEEVPASDENRLAYEELVEAGLMIQAHSFVGGWYYAPTRIGWKLMGMTDRFNAPSPSKSA